MKIKRYRCDDWGGCGRPIESWWSAFKRAWRERNDPPPEPSPMGPIVDAMLVSMIEEMRPGNIMRRVDGGPITFTFPPMLAEEVVIVDDVYRAQPPITDEDGGRRGD